jgi:hypothetical protein
MDNCLVHQSQPHAASSWKSAQPAQSGEVGYALLSVRQVPEVKDSEYRRGTGLRDSAESVAKRENFS